MFFIPVEFSFLFFVAFVGGALCLFIFVTFFSGSVYFERAGSLGVSLAGRVIFSFCVGFRCVECRSGTIYLDASLGWMAGAVQVFFFFGSVVVSTVRFI
jgi:hypothetical protein